MDCRIQKHAGSWISAAAQNQDSTRRALLLSAFLCICLVLLFQWTRSPLSRGCDCREPPRLADYSQKEGEFPGEGLSLVQRPLRNGSILADRVGASQTELLRTPPISRKALYFSRSCIVSLSDVQLSLWPGEFFPYRLTGA